MRKKFVAAVLAAAVVATATPVASVDAAKAVKKTYTIGVGKKATKKVAKKIKSVKTSNKKIVAVKKKGAKKFILTAKKAGTAKVTVKFGKKTLKATVKVGATKVKAVKKNVEIGVTSKAAVSVKATNGKKDAFTWKSKDKKVVTVEKAKTTANKNGKATNTITGVATGTSVITVKSKNTGKKATIKVVVTGAAVATKPVTAAAATGGVITVKVTGVTSASVVATAAGVNATGTSVKSKFVKNGTYKVEVSAPGKNSQLKEVKVDGKDVTVEVKF